MRLGSLILLILTLPASAQTFQPQKGSEILWDTYGIPHLYAKSTPDLFFLYGYSQAEAHANLLLHVYGESRGRAAEYFAPTEANVKADTWVWTNSIPTRSQSWLDQQTPEFRGYLEAFAAGINAYAAKHPEALSEESRRVLPVTALDPMEHAQHFIHFTFVAGQRLAEPAPPRQRASLEPAMPDDAAGSNGWAIAPSHSASGKSMLLSNPHLAWAGSQTYFEAELTAPGIHLYGATQVGFPVLRFAFNDFLGYTHTVNPIDVADLYRIKAGTTPAGEPGFSLDGEVVPFRTLAHTLKLRQPDGTFKEKPLDIREALQGPVIKEDSGDPIALRVAGLDKPFMLEQYWQMSTAHNFKEFETALRRLQSPMYNVLYADRDGHIEFFFGGALPKRPTLPDVPPEKALAFWAGIVPGDTTATLWHSYLTYDELPKVIDPPNGYVQNTNEPPWDAAWPNNLDPTKYPPYTSPVVISFRTERSLHMLANLDSPNPDHKLTFDAMLQKKLSTRAELADRILPDLLAAVDQFGTPQAKQAAQILTHWDRLTEANSKGAVLFYAWARQFMGPALSVQTNFAVSYALADPMHTPRGLKDPAKAAAMLDAAATETLHDFAALDVPWGKVMRFQINSQSDGNTTRPRTDAIDGADLPGNGGYGNLGIFRVVTFGPLLNGTRTPVHGDGYVAAIEFTTPPHAMMSLSYGNSSQPGSKFHTDQFPLLESKRLREALLTRPAVEAHLDHRESF